MIEYLFILLMVSFTVAGQLLLKKGAVGMKDVSSASRFIKSLFSKYIIAGAIVILIAPVFNILAMTRMSLGVAFSFSGLNYVFVVISAHYIFKERVNAFHLMGTGLILFGLVMFTL